MAIAPINYATIQRTADIETFKNQQDTKPMVDQQNIQVQVDHREDVPVSYTHLTLPTILRV